HVYRRAGDWQADGELPSPMIQDHFFGNAVAIHGDVAVVGTLGTQPRAVYVYRHDGAAWNLEAELHSPNEDFLVSNFQNESFGLSVAAFEDRIVVGAPFFPFDDQGVLAPACGIAYAFRFDGATWIPEASFQLDGARAGDRFGFDVDLVENAVAIGSPGRNGNEFTGEGAIGFASFDGAWSAVTEINPPMRDAALNEAALFGSSVAIAEHFGRLAILGGAPNAEIRGRGLSGACYWFEQLQTANWTFAGKLGSSTPDNADALGASVATDGDHAVCGLPGALDGEGQAVGAVALYSTPGFRQATEWLGNDGTFDDPAQWSDGRAPDGATSIVMAAGGRMTFDEDATVKGLLVPKGVGAIEPAGARVQAAGGVSVTGASTMFGVVGPGTLATNRVEAVDGTMMLIDTSIEGGSLEMLLNRGTVTMTGGTLDATDLRIGAALRGDVAIENAEIHAPLTIGKGVRLRLTDTTIAGSVQNTGEIIVSGASVIEGDCSLDGGADAGSMRFSIGLDGGVPTFDTLHIGGTAILAGSLTIDVDDVDL
ncbi:MAG: hypothetical protein KDA28_14750, partial [Phycisphaerales bacterium]|nr:hypothetical protein [Phycisphaerales bacterium]